MRALGMIVALALAAGLIWQLLHVTPGPTPGLDEGMRAGSLRSKGTDSAPADALPSGPEIRDAGPARTPAAPAMGTTDLADSPSASATFACDLHVFTEEGHHSPFGHLFEVRIEDGEGTHVLASGRTGADGRALLDMELRPQDKVSRAWAEVIGPGMLPRRYELEVFGDEVDTGFRKWTPSEVATTARILEQRSALSRWSRHGAYKLTLEPLRGGRVEIVFAGSSGEALRGRLFRVPSEAADEFGFEIRKALPARVLDGRVSYLVDVLEGEDAIYVGRSGARGTGATRSAELLAHDPAKPFTLIIDGTSQAKGRVVDPGGAPQSGLGFELLHADSITEDLVSRFGAGAVAAKVMTDGRGQFSVDGLREGTFTVRLLGSEQTLGTVEARRVAVPATLLWPGEDSELGTALTITWDASTWRDQGGGAPEVSVMPLEAGANAPAPGATPLPLEVHDDRAHALIPRDERVLVIAYHRRLAFEPIEVKAGPAGGIQRLELTPVANLGSGTLSVEAKRPGVSFVRLELHNLDTGLTRPLGRADGRSPHFLWLGEQGLDTLRFHLPVGRYTIRCVEATDHGARSKRRQLVGKGPPTGPVEIRAGKVMTVRVDLPTTVVVPQTESR